MPEEPSTIIENRGHIMEPKVTNAKKSESATSDVEGAQVQEQVLDAIKQSQQATLRAVQAWSESVATLVPNLPELPTMQLFEALPKPEEVSDQFFDFAQKILVSQQEFVKSLIDVLPKAAESIK
jgi:hypothetical protein